MGAAKEVPCALIRVCQRQPQHVKCKNVPKEMPDRCRHPQPPNPRPQPPKPHPQPPTNGCKCLNKELEGPGGLPIGNCLTRDPANGKFYCYVEANNGCSDSKPSRRLHNLIYSYEACRNQRVVDGFSAPECHCQDWDDQCFADCLAASSSED